jgi:hypothetical protein
MARLNFMDLSVDIKTLIVQHVSMGVSGSSARLGGRVRRPRSSGRSERACRGGLARSTCMSF